MNELSILNSNNFSNFIGKKSIIVGDLVPSKTSLLSQLLLHAIEFVKESVMYNLKFVLRSLLSE